MKKKPSLESKKKYECELEEIEERIAPNVAGYVGAEHSQGQGLHLGWSDLQSATDQGWYWR
ncbi:MAG: hypothetical protein HYU64_02035 [Armatimonadetes bacterium]|nr:hypothetical protein [Armatimonadota bacterium]